MDTPNLTIPTLTELREQIRERVTEVRALRQMLRLAEAAQAAAEARALQRPITALTREVSSEHR
jgi:hypothetical protein